MRSHQCLVSDVLLVSVLFYFTIYFCLHQPKCCVVQKGEKNAAASQQRCQNMFHVGAAVGIKQFMRDGGGNLVT